MAFKDPTVDDEARKMRIRKKINTIVGHEVNAEYLEKVAEGDTVEVELENVLRKGKIIRKYQTSARVFVPTTGEQWRISGYYLRKVGPKEEIV